MINVFVKWLLSLRTAALTHRGNDSASTQQYQGCSHVGNIIFQQVYLGKCLVYEIIFKPVIHCFRASYVDMCGQNLHPNLCIWRENMNT